MVRTTLSAILAMAYLVAGTLQAAAFGRVEGTDIRAQIANIRAGTTIEIRLSDDSRISGKFVRAAGDKLELEKIEAGQARVIQFTIADIRSVTMRLPGSDLELRPGALGTMVLDHKVKMMTRSGTYIEGKVLQAREDTLLVDVSKTEPKGLLRGNSEISTADIAVIYMKKNGNVAYPIVLGVLGGFLGGVAGAYGAYSISSGPLGGAMVLGGIAGGATAGACAGHELAKKTITINVAQKQ